MSTAIGKQSSLFSPTQIAGCQLWLDSTDSSTLTTSGTAVSQWNDKSGSGNNATATGTIRTTGSINGKTALNWSGSVSTYFQGALVNSGTTLTAFSVFTMNASSYIVARILSLGKPGFKDFNNVLYTAAIERNSTKFDSYREGSARSQVNAIFGTPVQVCSQYDGTNHTMYLNGTGGTSVASSGNFGFTHYEVGTDFDEEALVPLNGQIGEVLYFSGSLTTLQRQQIEGYLAWKWGLVANLPSSHPYKQTPLYQLPPFPLVPRVANATNLLPLDPRSISGCSLWLDAADVTSVILSGSNVTQWRDKSGNGRHATPSGTGPIYTNNLLNGFPAPVFNNSVLTTPSYTLSPTNRITVFVLSRQTGFIGSGNSDFFLASADYNYFDLFNGPFAQSAKVNMNGIEFFLQNSSISGTNMITCVQSDGTTITGFLQGTQRVTTALGSIVYSLNNTSGWTIGAGNYIGPIFEVIVYNTNITASQRQQVEGYLAWKWGLVSSLPSSHPYKFPIAPFSYGVRRVGARSFLPTNISGCSLWLDAADTSSLTLSGASVTQWRDKSGNGTLLSVDAGTPVLSNFNSLPSISFNGASRMVSASYTRLQNVSHINWFVVANITNVNLIYGMLIGTQYATNFNSQNSLYLHQNTLLSFFRVSGGSAPSSVSINVSAGSMLASSATNFVNGTRSVFLNGSGTTASGGPTGTQDTATVNLYIGHDNYPGEDFITGTISECLLYTSLLTQSQRQEVEGYLAWKWGLQGSLPSTHPYKLFPPLP
jgi:hypothetical protein